MIQITLLLPPDPAGSRVRNNNPLCFRGAFKIFTSSAGWRLSVRTHRSLLVLFCTICRSRKYFKNTHAHTHKKEHSRVFYWKVPGLLFFIKAACSDPRVVTTRRSSSVFSFPERRPNCCFCSMADI